MTLIEILIVQLDARRIGLPAENVRHIVAAAAIEPLPGGPAIVEGVLNVHGRMVPVLDLRRRFGLASLALDPDQHFVIADAGGRRVALRVDRALDVVQVASAALEPVESVMPGVPHVRALARLPDGVLVIHDLEQFLSLDEATAVDRALSRASRETAAADLSE